MGDLITHVNVMEIDEGAPVLLGRVYVEKGSVVFDVPEETQLMLEAMLVLDDRGDPLEASDGEVWVDALPKNIVGTYFWVAVP